MPDYLSDFDGHELAGVFVRVMLRPRLKLAARTGVAYRAGSRYAARTSWLGLLVIARFAGA